MLIPEAIKKLELYRKVSFIYYIHYNKVKSEKKRNHSGMQAFNRTDLNRTQEIKQIDLYFQVSDYFLYICYFSFDLLFHTQTKILVILHFLSIHNCREDHGNVTE